MRSARANLEVVQSLLETFQFTPRYEDLLEATYRCFIRPGQTVVDIGAHAGRHTVQFAELVGAEGAVHAFEPLPEAMGYLQSRGLGPHVRTYPIAISPKRGRTSFVYAKGAPEESGLRPKAYNRPDLVQPETITVETLPLDDMVDTIGPVHFIKVDAEGAEVDCLSSGAAMIRKHRPWITVEYGEPGYAAFSLQRRSLFDKAAELGYVMGDLFGGLMEDVADWEAVCDRAYWDWYLVPQEKREEWVATMPIFGWPKASERNELSRLQKENAQLRAEIDAMRSSTSWRISAPLRTLGQRLRP